MSRTLYAHPGALIWVFLFMACEYGCVEREGEKNLTKFSQVSQV